MRRLRLFSLLLLLIWAGAASADVEVHFYSRDSGSTFPHAFVRLTEADQATRQPIDTNFGFTAVRVSPAILLGAVHGKIETLDPAYVSRSDRHFSLMLTDEQYRTVLDVVERWRAAPQPSYRLNSRNCVHFVAEVASALGLHAPAEPKLMKKPRSFLHKVTRDNLALIRQWPTRYAVAAGPAPVAADAARPAQPTATPAQ